MTNDKLLRIYLNDHLAASVAGIELLRRAFRSNEGNRFGEVLKSLLGEIEEDRDELLSIINEVGGTPDRVKQAAAWMAEKAGRVKLNGRITSYSPLSRYLELEGLAVGVEAKLSMWRALRQLADTDARLDRDQLDGLVAKAERQRRDLEAARLEAAAIAFSEPRDPSSSDRPAATGT